MQKLIKKNLRQRGQGDARARFSSTFPQRIDPSLPLPLNVNQPKESSTMDSFDFDPHSLGDPQASTSSPSSSNRPLPPPEKKKRSELELSLVPPSPPFFFPLVFLLFRFMVLWKYSTDSPFRCTFLSEQNQACDACKSRRVKCDLADLPPSTPSCTKCVSKGIQCTSILNSTRAPPKRTGPRIEEAKRLYGSAESTSTVAQSGGGQLFENTNGLATLTVYGVAPGRTLPQVALSQAVER